MYSELLITLNAYLPNKVTNKLFRFQKKGKQVLPHMLETETKAGKFITVITEQVQVDTNNKMG